MLEVMGSNPTDRACAIMCAISVTCESHGLHGGT
jgi:hypothetical protein